MIFELGGQVWTQIGLVIHTETELQLFSIIGAVLRRKSLNISERNLLDYNGGFPPARKDVAKRGYT